MLDTLIQASKNVFQQVKNLVGTEEGALKISVGAGGDISRKIDIVAEEVVLETIRESNFSPIIVGEECGIIYKKNQTNEIFVVECF